tara:strand:- start:1865 stop:2881 length:1017 start_codon:yes stop_codon:yes gene_type:complete
MLGKKIFIFYHSKGNLKRISDYYIKPLLQLEEKKIFVMIIDNNFDNIFSNSFIGEDYLKFLYGVEIFLNNYLCNTFPKNCKKIYIHHDVYDTPLANKKIENEIRMRLIKYDYILLPSIKSKKVFDNLNIDFKKNNIKLDYIGYYKLDLFRKLKKNKILSSNILIAPTNIFSFPNMSLINNIFKIVDNILHYSKYNVIFRPHPANIETRQINMIKKKYKYNSRFFFDTSRNYIKVYLNSRCLITDLSGTAYTYAFLTDNPVIFFSNYEKKLKSLGYEKLNFFKDRKKIGFIINDVSSILKILSKNKISDTIKIKRKKLKKFFLIGSTKKRLSKFLNKIV